MATNPLWPAAGPDATCETCAWRYQGGRGTAVERCRRHRDARLDLDWPACPAYTATLDCAACAACCREAYHVLEVSRRDPFARRHGHLLTMQDARLTLPRPGGNCPCLKGKAGAWSCALYEERPRTCRDFAVGGPNCLEARRRVGLTP